MGLVRAVNSSCSSVLKPFLAQGAKPFLLRFRVLNWMYSLCWCPFPFFKIPFRKLSVKNLNQSPKLSLQLPPAQRPAQGGTCSVLENK